MTAKHAKLYKINSEYAALSSVDERLQWIIEYLDEGRFCDYGGYPSDWTTRGGWIYMATVDHDDAPKLIAMPIQEFIDEYKWTWVEDF